MSFNKALVLLSLLSFGIHQHAQAVQPNTVYSSAGIVTSIGIACECHQLHKKFSIIDSELHVIDEYITFIQDLSITKISSLKKETQKFLQAISELHQKTKDLETYLQSASNASFGSFLGLCTGWLASITLNNCQAIEPLLLTGTILTSLIATSTQIVIEQKKLSRQELVKTVYGTLLTRINNKTIRTQALNIIKTCTVNPEMKICMQELESELSSYQGVDLEEYIQQRYKKIKTLVGHAKIATKNIMQTSIAGAFGCTGWLCWSMWR